MQHIAATTEITPRLLGRTTSDLFHPVLVRMFCDSCNVNPAFQVQEEQHVVGHQSAPCEHFYSKEVGSCQDIHVRRQKILPSGDLAALRGRSDTVPSKDVLHRLVRQPMTQVGKSTNNVVVAPASVLFSDADNQL